MVRMGLSDFHFDIAMGYIGDTLQELNVPAKLIAEAATIAESMRVHILVR
jgi:hemoglobin